MRCGWKELLSILPPWLRPEVDRLCKLTGQEIRLRSGFGPELVLGDRKCWLEQKVTREDLLHCINLASRYSPWNAATVAQGYLTAPGGHRIGICGQVIVKDGVICGIREPTSLCIRIARDFDGIAAGTENFTESTLIIGPPGWGKTTLLRDMIRRKSDAGFHVCVVDERGELFSDGGCFPAGRCSDVLTSAPKAAGLDMVLRTMGPDWLAMDEVTAQHDCDALIRASNCGVKLMATAHAANITELRCRPVYTDLWKMKLFPNVLVLCPDKSWKLERMVT